MIAAYIGLGSNLRQPRQQLETAFQALEQLPRSRVQNASSLYRSAAIGPGDQPDYLNAVVHLQTELEPLPLLRALQQIERAQGRVRTLRWGPRTLDLDILLYGDREIATPRLRVPHPALAERNFVLYPLAEIAGQNLLLPDGSRLGTLLDLCPGTGLVSTGLRLGGAPAVP